jgi:hypothetical protein
VLEEKDVVRSAVAGRWEEVKPSVGVQTNWPRGFRGERGVLLRSRLEEESPGEPSRLVRSSSIDMVRREERASPSMETSEAERGSRWRWGGTEPAEARLELVAERGNCFVDDICIPR